MQQVYFQHGGRRVLLYTEWRHFHPHLYFSSVIIIPELNRCLWRSCKVQCATARGRAKVNTPTVCGTPPTPRSQLLHLCVFWRLDFPNLANACNQKNSAWNPFLSFFNAPFPSLLFILFLSTLSLPSFSPPFPSFFVPSLPHASYTFVWPNAFVPCECIRIYS